MNNILEKISQAKKIAIAGHVRPDGDCIGSCTAMYNYICKVYPRIQVDVFLEYIPDVFHFIKNIEKVNTKYDQETEYDVFISLDCGDTLRLGPANKYFENAKITINIDHHISNTEFADINYVKANASSTCETLFSILEENKIDRDIAESLYTGIIHDTGVFKHSNTSRQTMEIAGKLIEQGVSFSKIIDESFYQKTFMQNQLLGVSLMNSKLILDGKCIVSVITGEMLKQYNALPKDTDGIIDQLRVTKGVEVAIVIQEVEKETYKVSFRSNSTLDVSKIAVEFGGGGHVKAAGCTMTGTIENILARLIKCIELQMQEKTTNV